VPVGRFDAADACGGGVELCGGGVELCGGGGGGGELCGRRRRGRGAAGGRRGGRRAARLGRRRVRAGHRPLVAAGRGGRPLAQRLAHGRLVGRLRVMVPRQTEQERGRGRRVENDARPELFGREERQRAAQRRRR